MRFLLVSACSAPSIQPCTKNRQCHARSAQFENLTDSLSRPSRQHSHELVLKLAFKHFKVLPQILLWAVLLSLKQNLHSICLKLSLYVYVPMPAGCLRHLLVDQIYNALRSDTQLTCTALCSKQDSDMRLLVPCFPLRSSMCRVSNQIL